NRAATAACERVACSSAEYDTTQTLAQELCSPLYENGTLDASPVSAAIASATAAAAAAVAGKDATDTNDYPPCGTACQQQFIPQSGCGSLANKTCICNNPVTVTSVGRCESQTCNPQDRATILYLSYQLCAGVGGIGNASEAANQTVATQTAGSEVLPPTGVPGGVEPFTGDVPGDGVEPFTGDVPGDGVEPFTGGVSGKGFEMGGWIVLI
ncbi:MAG: hypothetical protein Q9183_003777, partial [Haloplaca sp. 2 TL-2023]